MALRRPNALITFCLPKNEARASGAAGIRETLSCFLHTGFWSGRVRLVTLINRFYGLGDILVPSTNNETFCSFSQTTKSVLESMKFSQSVGFALDWLLMVAPPPGTGSEPGLLSSLISVWWSLEFWWNLTGSTGAFTTFQMRWRMKETSEPSLDLREVLDLHLVHHSRTFSFLLCNLY